MIQKTNTQIQLEGKNFQNAMDSLLKSSIDIVKQNINRTSTNVENVYGSEENAIDLVRKGLMNSVEKAKELYSNAVKQKIESVRSTTEDMMEEVTANLKQFKTQAQSITRGGQDEIDALMREIIIEVESSYERSSASLRDIMGTIESKINETFKSKETDFKEISTVLKDKINQQIQTKVDSTQEIKKNVQDSLFNFKESEKESFDHLLGSVKDSFIESIEITDVSLETEYNNTVDYFKNKLFAEMENTTKNFSLFYEQTINLFDTVISQLSKSKESLEQSKEKLVTGSVTAMSSVAEQVEKSLHSMTDFLFDSFDKEKGKIQTELENKIKQYDTTYSKNLDTLVSSVMQSFEKGTKDGVGLLTANKTEIEAFAKEHTDKAISTFSNLTTDIRDLMDEFIDDQKRLIETSSLDIQKKLESNQAEIISKLESIPPQVISISDSFEESRKEKFTKASGEMDNALDLFGKEINDWAGDLNSIISQETSSVENNIDTKRSESKNTFSDAIKQLSDNQLEISKKNADSIKETVSSISTRFNELEPALSEKIDAMLTQFDDQITKFIEKSKDQGSSITDKVNDFQTQSTSLKTQSVDAYDKLDRNTKVQFENITKAADNLLKSMGDNINTKRPA